MKKFFDAIRTWLINSVSEAGKNRIIANIEAQNSREYRMQVAEFYFINSVIDDILDDPYWYEIAVNAMNARKDK